MFPNDALTSSIYNTSNTDNLNVLILSGTSTKTLLSVAYDLKDKRVIKVYCGSNGTVMFNNQNNGGLSDQRFMIQKCTGEVYVDSMRTSSISLTYLPYDVSNYNTSVYEYKLFSPFVLTRGTQDFIMMLGLSAFIILLALKVFYLFFYKANRK